MWISVRFDKTKYILHPWILICNPGALGVSINIKTPSSKAFDVLGYEKLLSIVCRVFGGLRERSADTLKLFGMITSYYLYKACGSRQENFLNLFILLDGRLKNLESGCRGGGNLANARILGEDQVFLQMLRYDGNFILCDPRIPRIVCALCLIAGIS